MLSKISKKKITLYILLLPVLALIVPTTVRGIAICALLYGLLCFFANKYAAIERKNTDPYTALGAAVIALLLGTMFFCRWAPSGQIEAIAGMLGTGKAALLLTLTVVLSAAASFGIYRLIEIAKKLIGRHGKEDGGAHYLLNFVYDKVNVITAVYIITVTVSILFFLLTGDDIKFHLERMDAIMQEFTEYGFSALPIRLYHSTAYGFGYASPMFYGDIFMWPFAAIAVIFGISVVNAYKLMLASIFVLTWLMARYSFGLTMSGRNRDVAVFLYMISVAVFGIATESCVGRDFAGMFVPLSFCSFYWIMCGDGKKLWKYCVLLALGVTGLLYSNVIDAAIVAFSLLIILAFMIRKLTAKKFVAIASAAILCIGLCAWFLLPMLEQMASQTFLVTRPEVRQELNDLGAYTVPFVGLLIPAGVLSHITASYGIENALSGHFAYGVLFYILVFYILLRKRKDIFNGKCNDRSFYIAITALMIFFTVFQTKLFPHNALRNIIGTIQFPWRVQTVMACFGSIIIVQILRATENKKLVSMLMALSVCFVVVTAYNDYGMEYLNSKNSDSTYGNYEYYTHSVGAGEYLPGELLDVNDRHGWKDVIEKRGNDVFCDNADVKYDFTKEFDSVTVNYSENTEKTAFEFPLFYYKGYSAIDTANGHTLDISKNENGLVQVETENASGSIKVLYEGTRLQTVSEWVSAVSAAIMIAYIVGQKTKDKRINV